MKSQENGPLLYSEFIANHPDFEAHPFEEQKRAFLVQASLGVEGEELHRFLVNNRDANLREVGQSLQLSSDGSFIDDS